MSKFRKKPIVIEAVQWTGANIEEVLPFLGDLSKLPNNDGYVHPGIGHCPPAGTLDIPTLEGTMTASAGDWIIKGIKGEFYPCKLDIFAATYEPVEGAVPKTNNGYELRANGWHVWADRIIAAEDAKETAERALEEAKETIRLTEGTVETEQRIAVQQQQLAERLGNQLTAAQAALVEAEREIGEAKRSEAHTAGVLRIMETDLRAQIAAAQAERDRAVREEMHSCIAAPAAGALRDLESALKYLTPGLPAHNAVLWALAALREAQPESRSQLRRIAAQKGELVPTFAPAGELTREAKVTDIARAAICSIGSFDPGLQGHYQQQLSAALAYRKLTGKEE